MSPHVTRAFVASTSAVLALALAACAPTQPTTQGAAAPSKLAAADVLRPNEHLKAEGIPDVPKALADRIGKYTEFKAVNVIAWHPTKRAMLVAHRRGATTQLHLLDGPMGTLDPLTDFPDPVGSATFEPKRGDYLVYSHATPAATKPRSCIATTSRAKQTTLLTDPTEKHSFGAWNHAGTALLMESTQLDKTAGANEARHRHHGRVADRPAASRHAKRKIASLPGGGWGEFRWAKGDADAVRA